MCRFFAAMLKNIPLGSPDSVLGEPLLRHAQVSCLLSNKDSELYNDRLCLFRALAYLNGHNDLNSNTVRHLKEFITKSGYDPKSFHGVTVKELPVVEEIEQRSNFIHDFDVQEGNYVGELARRIIGTFGKTVILLQCHDHVIHINDTEFFQVFAMP